MFCAAAARKNCSRTNFNLRRRKRRSPGGVLSCANSASAFFLSRCALAKAVVWTKSRARCRAGSCMWMARYFNGELVHCAFLRAPTATLARPDVDMGTVPSIVSAVVELLSGGAKVAVAFGKIRETLGTVERTVLAQSAVPRAHVGCDPPLH